MSLLECCIGCNTAFTKTLKGLNRKRVLTITTPTTAKAVFPDAPSPNQDAFICNPCVQFLKKNTRTKKTRKGVRYTISTHARKHTPMFTPGRSPNPKRRNCATSPTNTSEMMNQPTTPTSPTNSMEMSHLTPPSVGGCGPLAMAKRHLANSKYERAFKCFLKSSVTRRHMIAAVSKAIMEERKTLSKDVNGPFKKKPSPHNISAFTWDGALDWADTKAPLLMATLRATFPPAQKIKEPKKRPVNISSRDKHTVHKRRMGLALSIALFTGNKFDNFIQTCVGIEMWKEGCSHKVLRTLNHMGLSISLDATRSTIDKIWLGHDEKIKEWKSEAEKLPTKRRLFLSSAAPKSLCTYSVTWDNVQMFVHGKHQTRGHANTFLLFALAFGHHNKVNFSHLDGSGCLALEVPANKLLPTPESFNNLRERMVVLVMRILVANIPALFSMQRQVVHHIPHEYTKEMNSKSNIVNLGVLSSNPSSNSGVIEIMTFLHKYVPVKNNKLQPILCCGDGLSVERMIHCHRARNTGDTPADRLEGLIPTPQEFHREVLMLQDTMDLLYIQESDLARGTLAQLKNDFDHRSLKKKVSSNVQHCWDMIEFATSAYITLLATTTCKMSTIDDVPEDLPDDKADQLSWLRSLANFIVDFAWMPPDQEQINLVSSTAASSTGESSEEDIFMYCICREDKQESMLQCSSSSCHNRWLHLSCAGLSQAPEGDWFCSQQCEEDGTCIYCWCQCRGEGTMVQCQLAEACTKYEWYHMECLMPSERPHVQDTWYCSEQCKVLDSGQEGEDFILNYSKALMWEGLNHLAMKDAVREGDGPAMMEAWKMGLIQFWNKRHPKYFIIAHNMLTGVEGYLPECLRKDMIWNRVGNLTGTPGGNVGLDLINEFLNNDFKEMLKNSHGKYTDQEIKRCAEMGGAFGKDLDKILTNVGIMSFEEKGSRRAGYKERQREDVRRFVDEYRSDKLFSFVPGRYHRGLKNFKYQNKIKDPKKMGMKLKQLSQEMDKWDTYCGRTNIEG